MQRVSCLHASALVCMPALPTCPPRQLWDTHPHCNLALTRARTHSRTHACMHTRIRTHAHLALAVYLLNHIAQLCHSDAGKASGIAEHVHRTLRHSSPLVKQKVGAPHTLVLWRAWKWRTPTWRRQATWRIQASIMSWWLGSARPLVTRFFLCPRPLPARRRCGSSSTCARTAARSSSAACSSTRPPSGGFRAPVGSLSDAPVGAAALKDQATLPQFTLTTACVSGLLAESAAPPPTLPTPRLRCIPKPATGASTTKLARTGVRDRGFQHRSRCEAPLMPIGAPRTPRMRAAASPPPPHTGTWSSTARSRTPSAGTRPSRKCGRRPRRPWTACTTAWGSRAAAALAATAAAAA